MRRISTLLIANRGEIACRIMRTAKSLGIKTIAVYSDADADALHVRTADAAWPIGPSQVSASYLNHSAILDAALATQADAIHPGYGFLSENAEFAGACEQAGIIFVGPPKDAIEVMGDKARAKRAMIDAGVPCVPGYQGDDQSSATLLHQAEEIGLPVMVKAAAGGGGRGMRLVEQPDELASAIALAQSEAENAFGSRELIIEKAIVRPRHVEIQVFADQNGQAVYLGERDCSIQRRHQKVVEEAPCPIMTPALRAAMGQAAVEAARAVSYVGAGTVEFLLDETGDFFFLEMNTRLQVEHPVTELVTGFDLVDWQLRVARGESLPATQDRISLAGHAIEVRLYAEEPERGFLPATGPVVHFSVPSLEGVRVDAGIETGDAVSPFYDAMVAKVMAVGETREDARQRLLTALSGSALFGFASNRDFLIDVLSQSAFASGDATTAFIADHYGDFFDKPSVETSMIAVAAVIQHGMAQAQFQSQSLSVNDELLDWASTDDISFSRCYELDGQSFMTLLRASGPGDYCVNVGDSQHHLRRIDTGTTTAIYEVDGFRRQFMFAQSGDAQLWLASDTHSLMLLDTLSLPPQSAIADTGGAVVAPMHGQLLSVAVGVGEPVKAGQRLAVLEAMKMQHEITAALDGVVTELGAPPGGQVAAGDLILSIEELQ